jgi:hypothetical protein
MTCGALADRDPALGLGCVGAPKVASNQARLRAERGERVGGGGAVATGQAYPSFVRPRPQSG